MTIPAADQFRIGYAHAVTDRQVIFQGISVQDQRVRDGRLPLRTYRIDTALSLHSQEVGTAENKVEAAT